MRKAKVSWKQAAADKLVGSFRPTTNSESTVIVTVRRQRHDSGLASVGMTAESFEEPVAGVVQLSEILLPFQGQAVQLNADTKIAQTTEMQLVRHNVELGGTDAYMLKSHLNVDQADKLFSSLGQPAWESFPGV